MSGATAVATPNIDLTHATRYVNPSFRPLLNAAERFLVLLGGAGSGKSYGAAQKILLRTMVEHTTRHKFLVVRKVLRTQRYSCFALCNDIISDWGLTALFHSSSSNMEITFMPNGSKIIFTGLDDPEKIKSIAGITGMWIEEATELTEADFEQLNLRVRGVTDTYKQIILTFNPVSERHWIKRRFFDIIVPNARCVRTTYLDNEHLDAEYVGELERLKDRDMSLWNIYGIGEWGLLQGLIFDPPFPVLESYPTPESVIYGLDFGYNNPLALIRAGMRDGAFYTTVLNYTRETLVDELIARLPDLGVNRTDPIYGDSARPDEIERICRAGYNCKPCHKKPGSVSDGIKAMKAAQIFSCLGNVDLHNECATYKWAQDKYGNALDEPVDFNDHLIDALRYAITTHELRKPERRVVLQ